MHPDSIVVQEGPGPAQQLILLFHGYGANAEDLVPLGRRLAQAFPTALIVSVAAPGKRGYPGGRQWFSLDGVTDANRVTRVAEALPGFLAEIRGWQQRAGVAAERTALVGFSQGSIMVLEASLGDAPPAARVIAIAGRLAQLPAAAPLSVTFHLLHGQADPVMPCRHSVEAAQRLLELGGDVTADILPFVGHEIHDDLMRLAIQRLSSHVPKRLWDEAMRAAEAEGAQA
jgi:phospholipase/carboxylesterase